LVRIYGLKLHSSAPFLLNLINRIYPPRSLYFLSFLGGTPPLEGAKRERRWLDFLSPILVSATFTYKIVVKKIRLIAVNRKRESRVGQLGKGSLKIVKAKFVKWGLVADNGSRCY